MTTFSCWACISLVAWNVAKSIDLGENMVVALTYSRGLQYRPPNTIMTLNMGAPRKVALNQGNPKPIFLATSSFSPESGLRLLQGYE